MISIWSEQSSLPSFPTLAGEFKTDVLIVGGGMAGILCAYMLESAGVDYLLAEADRICGGVTKNTTAKITVQHGMIYQKLIKDFGTEKALMYLKANENALKKYRGLCKNIDCDFLTKDNIVYSVDDFKKAEREKEAFERLGYSTELSDKIPLPVKIAGAVRVKNQAQFNPLKFVSAIAKDLNIYENTRVAEIRGKRAITEKGVISADKFIVATHFPFINKFGAFPLKMYQERSYAIALENAPDVDGMYVDENQKGMSFRNYQNFLLIGGGDHRTGKQGGSFNELRTFARTKYPANRERYAWATQDCMTFDSVPYIGRYSKKLPDMFVATGFNKWGMSTSMAAAEILCDTVQEKENEFASVFSPSRNFIRPQFAVHLGEVAGSLLTPAKKRCPHMGCALKWNAYEHTWDCSCHGSRFTEEGKLIDNPATGDLNLK